ncbi:MAG: aldo/keto reductase [Patescibacteria group bacterium]
MRVEGGVGRTTLGKSEIEVSRLCFGTYKLGSKLDAPSALDLLVTAYESGINFFDTSDNYLGAEALIGIAIRDGILPRNEIVIATKTGLSRSEYEARDFQSAGKESDNSSSRIRQQVEHSLRVMGVDIIDLYQIHVYSSEVGPKGIASTMNDLINKGKIRHWGVSNYNEPALVEMNQVCEEENLQGPVSLQNFYNLRERKYEEAFLEARSNGMTILAFSPLYKGVLREHILSQINVLEENLAELRGQEAPLSERNKTELRNAEYSLRVVRKLKELNEYARDHGGNLQQLALAWILSKEATIPILGAYRKEYLEDLLPAASWELDDEGIALVDNYSEEDC